MTAILSLRPDATPRTVSRPRRWCILSVLGCSLLAGCYIPVEGIRAPNPGPTATPPWPYDAGVLPPGRTAEVPPSGTADTTNSPRPASRTTAYGESHAPTTPPPPSQSTPPQYADWLVDGAEGRGFAYYLAQGYRRYAKHEDNAHDFEDAAKFLFRAGAVDRGERVEPELLSVRTLPGYAVDDLLYARQRLMSVLHRGAAFRLPKLTASAQVNFDCWMEQQEENFQPHDIARCRGGFEADIVRLESALIERPQPQVPAIACPPPAPIQAGCDSPPPLYVLFDLDKHILDEAGKTVLQQAVGIAKRSAALSLIVAAHTDRAGSDAYNDALSRRRLDTILAALEANGLDPARLARASYFGETKPRIATPDGVPKAENRRVEIRFACPAPDKAPPVGTLPCPRIDP